MSKVNADFDLWYDRTFGTVLGAQDDDNRAGVKKIWNGALEYAASAFEPGLFDEVSGAEVAQNIRAMKVKTK